MIQNSIIAKFKLLFVWKQKLKKQLDYVQCIYQIRCDDHVDKLINGMTQVLMGKLMSVLEAQLSKLSRYDEGSLIGSILSFTVSWSQCENNNNQLKYTLTFASITNAECFRFGERSWPRLCKFCTK